MAEYQIEIQACLEHDNHGKPVLLIVLSGFPDDAQMEAFASKSREPVARAIMEVYGSEKIKWSKIDGNLVQ